MYSSMKIVIIPIFAIINLRLYFVGMYMHIPVNHFLNSMQMNAWEVELNGVFL